MAVASLDAFTLDSVESPRNSNWLLVVLAARRALTFLEQQPEVDGERLGVYGHSMGGRLTTQLTGIDKRVKAAVPSCGGSGDLLASSSEVPGGSRSKRSALELACVSENPYIERITAPTLWLSPTNDFHAHIDTMAYTWRSVPDTLLRLSISPHFNHRHTPENAITQHLWFEEHLKGLFRMPRTPEVVLNLKTPDGVPEILVRPDTTLPVKAVHIYYSTDPHGLTRFWRDAEPKKTAQQWSAAAPVSNTEDPIFVFANVFYETPEKYRDLPQSPGGANTAVFSLSSREYYATSEQLKTAGVKASDAPLRLIDDGSRGFHDWYRLNWGNGSLWSVTTRKVKDSKWRGPDGAKLVFEINPKTDATLVVKVTSNDWGAFSAGPKAEYYARKSLLGGALFQTVSVGLEEFIPADSKDTAPLVNWQTLTDLSLSPSVTFVKDGQKVTMEAKPWKDSRGTQVRNLRWEGGQYPAVQTKSTVLNEEPHRKSFNDAIKKSLEQEKLDKK